MTKRSFGLTVLSANPIGLTVQRLDPLSKPQGAQTVQIVSDPMTPKGRKPPRKGGR